jgi:hypothetical protein
MATFTEKQFSIVIMGGMNPSILNHDFLIRNEIIPANIAPFKDLLQKAEGHQFSEFVSSPIMSNIRYEYISLLVETQRLQALDLSGRKPSLSPIRDIVENYIRTLPFTPLKVGGFNFRGSLRFDNEEDEVSLDQALGSNRDKIKKLVESPGVRSSHHLQWPYKNGFALIQATKPKGVSFECSLNFNYEFEYAGDIDAFMTNFALIEKCHDEFTQILARLEVKC